MDKKKGAMNVIVSLASRMVHLAAALIVRRLLIRSLGNEMNGLNSLYTSIIGMLALAELGIGSAIIFSMYKPVVDGNKRQVAALYRLYKKLYRAVGLVIFAAGLIVTPFLPALISDYDRLNVNVHLTFLLCLVSVVLSYLYGAETSLIAAHKDNYITTSIVTAGSLVRYGLQAGAILIFRSFPLFLVCQIIETLLIWFLTRRVVKRRHGEITALRETVNEETRAEIIRNVKAMFMHRIGTVLVNTVDSVIISAFIGVVLLGKYSNYTMIAGVVSGTIALFFSPLTSVVGHLCAGGDRKKIKGWYDYFYCLNYILGVVFFLGYYAVIDYVIRLVFGAGLEVSRSIAFIITLNEFTKYMRKATLLFRDASGTFYYDRWKPIVEGIVNLILSLLFVNVFPEESRITGVIVATIITTLAICDIVDPYVVFKHVFRCPVKGFWIKNYVYTGLFVLSLIVMTWLGQPAEGMAGLILNGIISAGISAAVLGMVAVFDKSFRTEMLTMYKSIVQR